MFGKILWREGKPNHKTYSIWMILAHCTSFHSPLGGRHAAVQPALPEDQETVQPIGPYYPTLRELRAKSMQRENSEPPSHSPPSMYPGPSSPPLSVQRSRLGKDGPYSPSGVAYSPHSRRSSLNFVSLPELNIREYQPPSSSEPSRKRARTTAPPPPPLQSGGDFVRHSSSSPPSPSPTSKSPVNSIGAAALVPRYSVTDNSGILDDTSERGRKKPSVPATLAGIMNAYPSGGPSSTRSASGIPSSEDDDDS
jgi:hypothetical protein